MNAPKPNLKRERGYPHIATIMRLLSTLTEPGAFIQGRDVPWRKVLCTLSMKKKILSSTEGNKLGWRAGLVHGDELRMWLNRLVVRALMDKVC